MIATPQIASSPQDAFSDYGSDWDEELVNELYDRTSNSGLDAAPALIVTDIEDYEEPRGVRLPKILGCDSWAPSLSQDFSTSHQPLGQQTTLRDDDLVETAEGSEEEQRLRELRAASIPEETPEHSVLVTRSPLERFRQPPKKALSVTDLVSPAWCELQYFYTLSKHGKKKRTPAMRQGSKIHKKLEDEVHVTVPVQVTTKEDAWGLRIWNIIQGLRSLRNTGVTRELEIWGLIDGELVNGVIDELTYTCPDPDSEIDAESRLPDESGSKLLPGQKTITDFLLSTSGGQGTKIEALQIPSESASHETAGREDRIYVIDTKTRSSKSLPNRSSQLPAQLQLHIYHCLLTQFARGNFPLSFIAARYSLDLSRPFTDAFIARVGTLNDDFIDAVSSQEANGNSTSQQPPFSSQDSLDVLLTHNTLPALWSLMVTEFQQTVFTSTSPFRSRLSSLLTARYVSATDGSLLGVKSLAYDQNYLDRYLMDGMKWWRGERKARGVELQDTWKCRGCEFRDDCEWLQEKDQENVENVQKKIVRRTFVERKENNQD